MSIVESFRAHFSLHEAIDNDFSLFMYQDGPFVGVDREYNPSVIIESTTPHRVSSMQETKMLSLECNVPVKSSIGGSVVNQTVHIVRCFSRADKEVELFLEIASLLLGGGNQSQEDIIETFNTLSSFFSEKSEPSYQELIGLYAELYTIKKFNTIIPLEKHWHSKDRMKFDFSISEELKLEVKATTKDMRIHHFNHEQLTAINMEIFVLSFVLRQDDEGMSLLELLNECKPFFIPYKEKYIQIARYLKNTSEERLRNIRFNTDYTESKRKFFDAKDIPHFASSAPDGLINVEYDCVLENVKSIDDDSFFSRCLLEIEGRL